MLYIYTETLWCVHRLSIAHYEGTYIRTFDSTSEGTSINNLYCTHECITRHMYQWLLILHQRAWWHTYQWVVSHTWMHDGTHIYDLCRTHECMKAHISISCVAHMNAWWHTYQWVVSHTWMHHVVYMPVNLSYHTFEEARMSHITHMDESCHTYEWVVWHIWISHVAYMNGSCHKCECVMPHTSECAETQHERVCVCVCMFVFGITSF